MKKIIDFNHISSDLSAEEVEKLKRWFTYYHKLCTCYKWGYKRAKKTRLILNMASIGLTSMGIIIGSAIMNPIVIGVLSGTGILIQGYTAKSKLPSKVEECKFAYTSYQKVLTQLRSYLRGLPYDSATLLSDLKVLDDIVTDLCPPVNGMSIRYDKIYGNV